MKPLHQQAFDILSAGIKPMPSLDDRGNAYFAEDLNRKAEDCDHPDEFREVQDNSFTYGQSHTGPAGTQIDITVYCNKCGQEVS